LVTTKVAKRVRGSSVSSGKRLVRCMVGPP
jgi:hypothetical protein